MKSPTPPPGADSQRLWCSGAIRGALRWAPGHFHGKMTVPYTVYLMFLVIDIWYSIGIFYCFIVCFFSMCYIVVYSVIVVIVIVVVVVMMIPMVVIYIYILRRVFLCYIDVRWIYAVIIKSPWFSLGHCCKISLDSRWNLLQFHHLLTVSLGWKNKKTARVHRLSESLCLLSSRLIN